MPPIVDSRSRRLHGSIEIKKIPRSEWPMDKVGQLFSSRSIYTWWPPYQIGCQLSQDSQIRLECWQAENGLRWFSVPERLEPLRALICKASLVGHAILVDQGSDEQTGPLLHDEARLFNQRAQHAQEYLGQTLKLDGALFISRAARLDAVWVRSVR